MMKKYLGLTALAGALVLGGGWILSQGASSTEGSLLPPGAAMAQDAPAADAAETPADPALVQIADMRMGAPDAPVTVIEYGSYTCPHCADFHADQLQRLTADYIDTGKVNFIFREVYFDRFGLWASMVARCGGEMRFFPVSDLIFDQQRDWIAGGQDPQLIADNLRTIGISAGMEADQVDACMSDEVMAQSLVAWFQANATADGINGTPTLIIDGTKYDNMPYEEIQAIIDAALEG